MAVMSISAILLLFEVVLCLSPLTEENGCSKNRTELDSSQVLMITLCASPAAEQFNHRTLERIPTGSTCDVKCVQSEVRSWRQCQHNHIWIGPDVNCDLGRKEIIYHRSKRGFFRRFFRAVGNFFRSVGCFFFGCRKRRNPLDRTKPEISCPLDITRVADPIQVNTKVRWAETTTAWDARDGTVPARRSGLVPGKLFSEGTTTMGYYAKDKSGNMASCTFRITITVTRCKKLKRQTDGYRICHPSHDMRRGGSCYFGCYDGHELEPSTSKITCQDSGNWDNNQPTCKKIECPDIVAASELISISCTDGTKFRSICTYSCVDGYDIPTGSTRVRVCTSDRTWKGTAPTCLDVKPPLFTHCPYSVVGYTDQGTNTGHVYWNKPSVEDNSGEVIEAQQLSGPLVGDVLKPGVYTAAFAASDSTGNNAKQCKIKVVMKLITCYSLYPRPYTHVACPDGMKYGSQCMFSCDNGAALIGNDIVKCEKSWSDPPYGVWSFIDDQPYCTIVSKCLDLNAPDNGALACDYWLGGKFCTMMCRKGYDVSVRFPFYEHLVCGNSGKWSPAQFVAPNLPACEEIKNPEAHTRRMSILYYFDGNCNDEDVQREIKKAFVELLQESVFRDWCYEPDCNLENVDVSCWENARKKRDIESPGQTTDNLQIALDLSMKFGLNDTVESSNIKENTILGVINSVADSGQLQQEVGNNLSLSFKSMKTEPVKVLCPQGSIASKHTGKCVVCAAGTFYTINTSEETDSCKVCPKGEYQPETAQQSCVPCPDFQTTKQPGTKLKDECIDGCAAGSWSADGVPPCSSCDIDSYQAAYGATSCKHCPGSRITTDEGAISEDTCSEYDIVFPSVNADVIAILEGLTTTDVNTLSLVFWIQCMTCSNPELVSLKSRDDAEILKLTGWEEFSIATNGQLVSTNYGIQDDVWHSIGLSVENLSLAMYVDGNKVFEASMVFALSSIASIVIGGGNMQGSVSQFNIWSFRNDKALLERSRMCFSSESGNLVNWRMFAKANHTGAFLQTPSECDDIDGCLDNPCIHGSCSDGLNDFTCTCQPGYTGDTCAVNIDDCVSHVCQNNATCIDGALSYSCSCQKGFIGQYCEIATVDGKWGQWSNWTDCSVTCGNGRVSRFRVCDNPAPDKGTECLGNDEETDDCQEHVCPSCFDLEPPQNGYIEYENDTESDLLSCTIYCNDDYEFDQEPMTQYKCGKETFYMWDFQTVDNPHAQLPSCTVKHNAERLTVTYSNTYDTLTCTDDNMVDVVTHITDKVESATGYIPCIDTEQCSVTGISVTNCRTQRQKRTTDDEVSFNVDFICDPDSIGGDECFDALVDALGMIETIAREGSFTIPISDTNYQLRDNSSTISGEATCAPGSVPIGYYCVYCGLGTFEDDLECSLCDYGSYSDTVGQVTCLSCPKGKTTLGTGSRSLEECVVPVDIPLENEEHIIPAILIPTGVFVILVIISVAIFRKCNKKKTETEYPFRNVVRKLTAKPVFSIIERHPSSKESARDSLEGKDNPPPVLVNNYVTSDTRRW